MCGMHRGMRRWRKGWAEEGGDHESHRSWWTGHPFRSSGNRAFDEYKAETLKRLAEEQREFLAFLERLRHARDQDEFDRFMADRRAPQQAQGA
jgi:Protein of unknown function (DUF2852)